MATLVALALAAVSVVGTIGLLRADAGTSSQDQCAEPVSARTGGWFCFGEAPAP